MTFGPKTDAQLAGELRDILQAYCDKGNELRVRGLLANFSIANGGDGNPVAIQSFDVIKKIAVAEKVNDNTPF